LNDIYAQRLNRPESDFRQYVAHNGEKITSHIFTQKKVDKPGIQEVEGDRALINFTSYLNIGNPISVPMWNSGFWVSFRPATNSEFCELIRLINSDKIAFGRQSLGISLSNTGVYSLDRIFSFCLAHVASTSVKTDELPLYDLYKYLVPQDLESFIWGFLVSNYPSGFHFKTPCINNPTKCTHIHEGTLSIAKLQLTDNKLLTKWQKEHMVSRVPNTKRLDDVKRFQSENAGLQEKRIIINKESKPLGITLGTPSIQDFVIEGKEWISTIETAVIEALGNDSSSEDRNQYVNKLVNAAHLCQFAHWIKSIDTGILEPDDAGDVYIKRTVDRKTIRAQLESLSTVDSLRIEIQEEIQKFIANSTNTVIGYPVFDCPVCKEPQERDIEGKSDVRKAAIPLDIIQVFFELLDQRVTNLNRGL
jgi:hypothetical protein